MINRRRFLIGLTSLVTCRTYASSAVDFAPVFPGRKLSFPTDYGAHPQFRTEWWYATGWLALPDGIPMGFQATFFRVRTGIAEGNPSAFAPHQLIFAHAAIADPRAGQLLQDQRAARVGFGRAGFNSGRTHVWVGDWRLEQQKEEYVATIAGKDFSYALTLTPQGPPMLNGVDGFSQKAADPRHASYYYSRPQITVSGTVTLAGTSQQVSGKAWLDHEWSSELLPSTAQGWDWVGLNLNDGGALMAFRLRDQEALPIWTAATFMKSNGTKLRLGINEISLEPTRYWQSNRTGTRYPVEWTLKLARRLLRLVPLLDDQELDSRHTTGTVYWEGAVRVYENRTEIGRGYLELTGYGEKILVR